MKSEKAAHESPNSNKRQPYTVRLPEFITDDEIGLGDVVRRATAYLGKKPCGGCQRRAEALNGWLVFSGKQSR